MRNVLALIALAAALAVTSFLWPRGGETLPGRALSGHEIKHLLTGNTAIGFWGEDHYRQFFDKSGATYYAPRGKRSTRGKWRVTRDNAAYESWWTGAEDNWERFDLRLTSDGYAWVDGAGMLHGFELVAGQQLVWDE